MLEVGTKAPDFSLQDQNGNTHTLADYAGKTIILYFYPKDNTPGCTSQACGYTAKQPDYAAKGITVLGVSGDSVASHKKFEEKQSLGFTLLADPEHTALEAYDVWKEKNKFGRTYMGTVRTTYIIDGEGIIRFANDKVKAKDDPEFMLEKLAELGL